MKNVILVSGIVNVRIKMSRNSDAFNKAKDLNHVEEDIELLQEEEVEMQDSDDTPDLTERKRCFGEDMLGMEDYE